MKFCDIAVNFSDGMFRGVYRGKVVHAGDDSGQVLKRAWDSGVKRLMFTGVSLESSRECISLIESLNKDGPSDIGMEYRSTVGCHPTNCNEFLGGGGGDGHGGGADEYLSELINVAIDGQGKGIVSAIGEIGLDYDRLEFCPREIQQKYFRLQVEALSHLHLPFFLHLRGNCVDDFLDILSPFKNDIKGVVHSFDGTVETMHRLVDWGLFIGLNGCSLRTQDNLKVVHDIPIDRIMIETDSPWCDIRPSHASYTHLDIDDYGDSLSIVKKEKFKMGSVVKGRNEPCFVRQVLKVISKVKNVPEDKLAELIYKNSSEMFF